MPGPNGTVSILIMIRCPSEVRKVSRDLFLLFRKAGAGVVQHLGVWRSNIDAGDNIEAIPPYTFKGKAGPAERLVVGKHGDKSHHVFSYLEAQESQKPLRLDTSWLAFGHVDEFFQLIPAKDDRGWVAVISDHRLAIKLLEDTEMAGHGSLPAISRKKNTRWPKSCHVSECHQPVNSITVSQTLSDKRLIMLNDVCAERIDKNINILKADVGLTNEDIIRIPSLFIESNSMEFEGPCWGLKVGAFFPAVINNLVLTGYNTCIAPHPWVQLSEGRYFVEEIRNKYAEIGMKIEFIDDWNSHYRVHCSTNSSRNMSAKWWRSRWVAGSDRPLVIRF
ncbi:protein-arginine deiminase type II [Fusarium fujikuroi]|nr:protein-arginine deiminase type II [Fusarium fujikuroi]